LPPQQAGLTFLVSTLLALWSASGGVRAILEGLDVAYEVREDRGFLKLVGISLLVTVLGIVAAVISLNIAVVFPLLLADFPYRGEARRIVSLLSWPAAFGFGIFALSLVYRFGPNRRRAWRCFSWGSALASGAWLAGTALFKLYVGYFGSFDRIYGSLGAVIGFMVWIWISLVILLFGAELNREAERAGESGDTAPPSSA
jgi:membrane protein